MPKWHHYYYSCFHTTVTFSHRFTNDDIHHRNLKLLSNGNNFQPFSERGSLHLPKSVISWCMETGVTFKDAILDIVKD